ncbi:TetR/AcrR family transcriptional regulator [Streptomyces sp. NPDC058045]|uniref:TetR/AcrR family transcriptional regulator n=1 Tax=Streptomyces sp. NPDC058045 TaxID=3346311 RepID=UPI0036E38FA3
MGPKQQRGEATVAQVLDCALELYAASGEAGLTVGAITSASGVSAGSVYHHFGSLQGVLAALAERWLGRMLTEMTAALGRADEDARGGVEAVIRAYLGFVRHHPEASRLMHSVAVDRHAMEHGRQLRSNQEARLAPLANWLHARREAGQLAQLPVPVLESLVLGPVTAIARRWISIGDIDLDEALRTLPDHVWRSVSPDA